MDVYSVEGLYYCSDVIEAVAREQAKVLKYNADEMIKEAQKRVFYILNENGFAEMMTAWRCERKVRNSMLSQLSWEQIRDNQSVNISEDVGPLYYKELTRFRKIVDEQDLDELFAHYPLHKSRILDTIAETLKFPDKKIYARRVVTKIQKDDELAQKLKSRIRRLSEALEAEAAEVRVS